MKRRIKNSQTFSNVKLVADDGLIEWFNQLLVSIFRKWPMSLLHVITDFVSFVTAFLLKNPSLTHAVVPPFRNRSRSSRLFGCKSPHDGSLSLPTFADYWTTARVVPTVWYVFLIRAKHLLLFAIHSSLFTLLCRKACPCPQKITYKIKSTDNRKGCPYGCA